MKLKKLKRYVVILMVISGMAIEGSAQKTIYIRPVETDEVLTNPGIGFMTFQRFNGDELNEGSGWTEGFPIEYQEFDGNLENKDHPMTSIAYFRIYWKFLEPEMDKYNWAMIDLALKTAHERQQTLLLRIAPYGNGPEKDVPAWYRAMVGEGDEWLPGGQKGWRVDAEDPRYAQYFGKFITALGQRYDGHPDLEAVDLSILGFWGEGRGSAIVTQKTRAALVNAYTDNFKKTPLIMLLTDEKTNKYGMTQANVGWRVDCIGDLGFWAEEQDGWTHMYRYYPQGIINFGMKDAWKKAPVSLEICGTLKSWKEKQGYNADDVDYIIDETLKWHISSFNAKSSGVPEEWWPQINRWLKKMGYRFVLRSFAYPEFVAPNQKLHFKSWWENKGVAPCYKEFPLAIRLKNEKRTHILVTKADIRTWLPGDNLYDDAVFVPPDMSAGEYILQIGIIDLQSHEPKVKLAIEGVDQDGWYTIGNINITE
ncbi:MAG: DUF4832 domain-containing protein [Methanosarcinaceae archaeon]